jgi:stage IV sporulation protein FB
MRIGTVCDVDIKVNELLILLIVAAFAYGRGMEVSTVFFVLMVHEAAHVIVARILGIKVREIDLLPFGGTVKLDSVFELNPMHEIWIALSGPILNVWMVLSYVALVEAGIINVEQNDFFVQANLMLAGFNMLPALPLDGGRILRALLSRGLGFRKATNITANCGIILGMMISAVGIYTLDSGIINPTLLITPVFLIYSAIMEKKTAAYIFLRSISYKRDTLLKYRTMQVDDMAALYDIPIKEVLEKFAVHRYHNVRVVDEQFRQMGTLTEAQIIKGMMDYGVDVSLGALIAYENGRDKIKIPLR